MKVRAHRRLFAAWLAAGLLACSRGQEGTAGAAVPFEEDFPRTEGRLQLEHWFDVFSHGDIIGSWHIEQFAYPDGGMLLCMRSEMKIRYGEDELRWSLFEKVWLDGDFHPRRISSQERAEEEVALEAGVSQGEWLVVKGPERRRSKLRPEAVVLYSYRPLFPAGQPEDGEERRFVTFDSERGDYTEETLKIVSCSREKEFLCRAELIDKNEPEIVIGLLLDEKLEPRELNSRLGRLEMNFIRRGHGPAKSGGGFDLAKLRSIPSPSPVGEPRRQKVLRLRLRDLPAGIAPSRLEGPGQRVLGADEQGLVVEVFQPPMPENRAWPLEVPPELEQWTKPTAFARSDDPKIRAAARKALEGVKTAGYAAIKLRRLVSENIRPAQGRSVATASGVFRSGRGDCDEQAILLVALSRAVGIPARAVNGMVWEGGAFYFHMWTELWLGDWYPLDPSQNSDSVGPGWLRLGEYPLGIEEAASNASDWLVLMTSNMKIEILDPR